MQGSPVSRRGQPKKVDRMSNEVMRRYEALVGRWSLPLKVLTRLAGGRLLGSAVLACVPPSDLVREFPARATPFADAFADRAVRPADHPVVGATRTLDLEDRRDDVRS
jgi:hypothetical protein